MSCNDIDSILNGFKRKASPNRLVVDNRNRIGNPVATKLVYDNESLDGGRNDNAKRKKWSDGESFSSPNTSTSALDDSASGYNWESARLKRELIDATTKIATLETRVSQLHTLRRELEVVFEAEKNSLLQQQSYDQRKIQSLETRIAQMRRKESDLRDSDALTGKDFETANLRLEQLIHTLRREKGQLADEIFELKRSLRNAANKTDEKEAKINNLKLIIDKYEAEKEQAVSNDSSHSIALNEKISCELREAQRTIKDLERQLEDCHEASSTVKAQQQKLIKIPQMERELECLRNDVAKLRDAVHNKLILEEEVNDLRQKCASSDERMKNLVHVEVEAHKQLLEKKLEDWKALVQDFCSVSSSDDVSPGVLRKYIQALQQSELLLSSEVGELQTKLKSCFSQLSKAESEVSRLTLDVSRFKTSQEQQTNLIKRWQKKLALLTGERNSYRELLDSYEKELTVSVSSQRQSARPHIEEFEKSLERYRDLVENLEADLAAALGQGGSGGLLDKLRLVSAERDALNVEKQNLQKRVDELQLHMEHQVMKGDFNPVSTRVLHLRMNPVAHAEEEREKEVENLRTEVAKLRERVKVLQEGERDDITCKVDNRLATSNSQEVLELREKVKSTDLMMQRLKEVFKKTSSEFRDCIYNLFGYKVDRLQNKGGLFRLTSMYAESPGDFLLFKMQENRTFTLLETAFSESLGDLIETHLHQQGSLPTFHAALTIDLFNRQSMLVPSTSADEDEPIVVLD